MRRIRSYKCYKSLDMISGERAFTSGKYYNAFRRENGNGYEMSDDFSENITHIMPNIWFKRYFKFKYGK